MMLLTKELKAKLPPLYTNENKKAEEVPVIVKFFSPFSNWTWYATEGSYNLKNGDYASLQSNAKNEDIEDVTFFGFVRGHEGELGYFSLSELQSLGHKIERDRYFSNHTLAEVMEKQL